VHGGVKGNGFMNDVQIIGILIVFIIVLLIAFLIIFFTSPFKFPYKDFYFNVSGKRSPDINGLIEKYLIDKGIEEFDNKLKEYEIWKRYCEEKIKKSAFKSRRQRQFDSCLDYNHLFRFILFRYTTKYKQHNYVKHAYKVKTYVSSHSISYSQIKERYNQLHDINFECTLSEYHAKNQRKRATKELRNQIAKRDNYTCQICGKHMPDSVGLQIDHIIPINKGGKSIPSNLQVLCSICNGRKSNKQISI